jgi:lipopolysaccharide biosynthesis regulator YciM
VDTGKQLISIETKVRKLIALYSDATNELTESKKKIEDLQTIIEEQNSIINHLKGKSTLLTIAKTTENKEGITDAKLKINELIREIDKCIGLLQV